MKTDKPRLNIINEFEQAPDTALFTQDTVAALLNCSLATIERDRWAGTGIPFIKIGRLVRYRKTDVRAWLANHQPVQSTTQAQLMKENQTIKADASSAKNSSMPKIINQG